MKHFISTLLAIIPLLAFSQNNSHRAKEPVNVDTLAKLKSLVVSNPNDLVAPGAPSNYLLDKEGRIIFKNFRIDGRNERMLELMITELLNK